MSLLETLLNLQTLLSSVLKEVSVYSFCCIRSMQQAVKKDGVDGCDFDLSRMSCASLHIERPKPEFVHIGVSISISSTEPWGSCKGKRNKNDGLCLSPPPTSHTYIPRVKLDCVDPALHCSFLGRWERGYSAAVSNCIGTRYSPKLKLDNVAQWCLSTRFPAEIIWLSRTRNT